MSDCRRVPRGCTTHYRNLDDVRRYAEQYKGLRLEGKGEEAVLTLMDLREFRLRRDAEAAAAPERR